ncbi:MAG TPA: PIN domain-containing protein [Gemmataceae bacterium]|nr:PIN domain-containing protein [Gemmataceae bacterium]
MSSPFLTSLQDRLSRYFSKRPPSGNVLLWLLRGVFGAICIGIAMLAFRHFSEGPGDAANGYIAFLCILGAGLLIVLSDILIRNKQITTLSAIYFGLLLGLLLGNILSTALEPFIFDWGSMRSSMGQSDAAQLYVVPGDKEGTFKIDITRGAGAAVNVTPQEQRTQYERRALSLIITVICCYIAISTLLQTKDEFRFIIPYVEFSKQVKGAKPLVLDTSVIIDGRIADICDTRFIDTKMIVPRFVLQELQSVADSSDKLKRNRGRRGLDMLKRMQNNPKVELQMHEANLPVLREVHKVDERLVVLAKALDARVVTNDYNLNKIAQLQGVEVINLNELANALKSVALPGEVMTVRLVKPGDQYGQGVGYLEDGTMVVVEQGRTMIGQDVPITVTSVLQTPAGRMIFGRVEGRPQSVTT